MPRGIFKFFMPKAARSSASRDIAGKFERACSLKQQGQIAEATVICREILELRPDHFESVVVLAEIAASEGDPEKAIELYAKFIELTPNHAPAYYKRGNLLNERNQMQAALADYDQAVALDPAYANAFCNRGVVLCRLDRLDSSLASYNRAIALNPADALAFYNRGSVLRQLKRSEEALASYDQAIEINPDYAEAYYNRSVLLTELKKWDVALASADHAIALNPDLAEAHCSRGILLTELRQWNAALASVDRAIALKPDLAEAYCCRGNVFSALRQDETAIANYNQALILNPRYADAFHNRALALGNLKQFVAAIESYDQALACNPDFHFLLGMRRHAQMNICDWHDLESDIHRLGAGIENGEAVSPPFPILALLDSQSLQRKAAEIWVRERHPPHQALPAIPRRPEHGRLRIGYFSGDFREHPMSYLMAGLFEAHDRSKFELSAFSLGPHVQDDMRKRLETAFDRFIDVQEKSDQGVALLARQMAIDVAVDLGGFTRDARPNIFAMRAAPLQVSFLGYPGTMGAQYIEYLIADRTVIPQNSQPHYTEKIIYLPDSYWPNSYRINEERRGMADRVFSREEFGLPRTGFVFCCFNNTYKITPGIFDRWMGILRRVEGSVLWLFEENPSLANNLRQEAERRNVRAQRLIFARRIPLPDHLARHRAADLVLDTLPCNAHTTASDALWAGLPVVTCVGGAFAGRVAASLLTALRLPELITANLEDYENLAVELALNPQRLAEIRQKLAEHRLTTPLFDTSLFAGYLETAYTKIHARCQAGLPPEHIDVGLQRTTGYTPIMQQ